MTTPVNTNISSQIANIDVTDLSAVDQLLGAIDTFKKEQPSVANSALVEFVQKILNSSSLNTSLFLLAEQVIVLIKPTDDKSSWVKKMCEVNLQQKIRQIQSV